MFYRVSILSAVFLFVVLSCLFIPYAGIQADEAIFVSGIFGRIGIADLVSIRTPFLKIELPLMLMSYLGALKAWLYGILFKVLTPSAVSVRVPVILAAAATVFLFAGLLRRIAGRRAAILGCVLLATDTNFLLTSCYDWGPVVLQHLLLVAGLLATLEFYHTRRLGRLGLAGFLFGLAIWDKALFVWMLSSLVVSAALLFPRQLRDSLCRRTVAVAALSFGLGALPLILYNVRQSGATFRQDTSFSLAAIVGKAEILRLTFAGTGLMSYIVRIDPEGAPRQPVNGLERASVSLDAAIAGDRQSYLLQAALAALLMIPFWWRSPHRRVMLLAALTFGLAWFQMAASKNTGGSVHHTVLLWPLPAFFIAMAWSDFWGRHRFAPGLVSAAVVLVVVSNLLTLNQHLARLIVNGPAVVWSDALYPLHRFLEAHPSDRVVTMDWGIFDPLKLLSQGKLPLRVGEDPLLKPQLTGQEVHDVVAWLKPGNLIVGHTDGNEQFAGINQNLRTLAAEAGFERETLAFIPDRNGRRIFEVFRYRKNERAARP